MLDVPLFVSQRTLGLRRRFPRATAPWALDSGGFTELSTYGEWRTSPALYIGRTRLYAEEVGSLAFAAPQDWMCEPAILEQTGLDVAEHQRRTVASYIQLRDAGLPVIPVLQGWERDDYLRCWQLYERSGVVLEDAELVGLGTVCRRQDTTAAEVIVLALRPLRLHGFGMKAQGLGRYGYLLASADSMAWSYGGRRRRPDLHPGCEKKACANCPEYALAWRSRVLAAIGGPQQGHLDL